MLPLGIVALAAAVAVAAVTFVFGGARHPEPVPAAADLAGTAQVTVMTIAETAAVDGDLGYGPAEPVESRAAGTLTWLPAVGAVLSRGDVLLRADDKPVLLFYGTLPMYRELTLDTAGEDVKQFETNLRALGYGGFTVDEHYTASTVEAVKRWQRHLHLEETGMVGMDAVVYTPTAIRVAAHSVRIGAAAQGQLFTYTADTRVVTVNAPARNASWAVTGTQVTVELPGGSRVAGVVSFVGTEATAPSSPGENAPGNGTQNATVPVTVSIADQAALGPLERAPVEVRHTAQEHSDVLTVPVVALLAPIEGGYALEIVDGTNARIVPVETGLFADGRVEVRGAGIAAGMTVRVPA